MDATSKLLEMTTTFSKALQQGQATMLSLKELKQYVEIHFDELDLSPLLRGLRRRGCEREFNAYMALMNKYLGLSKELIPFEIDLQDYVLADKIMKSII